jgi:pentatricopeptide repeat protein
MLGDVVLRDAVCYAAAVEALERVGELARAIGVFDAMSADGVAPDARCYAAALGMCERGALAEPARAFDEMAAARVAPSDDAVDATVSPTLGVRADLRVSGRESTAEPLAVGRRVLDSQAGGASCACF